MTTSLPRTYLSLASSWGVLFVGDELPHLGSSSPPPPPRLATQSNGLSQYLPQSECVFVMSYVLLSYTGLTVGISQRHFKPHLSVTICFLNVHEFNPCCEQNRKIRRLFHELRLQSCMLSDEALRPTFETIFQEKYAQAVNRKFLSFI
jgi:hypothetical protein